MADQVEAKVKSEKNISIKTGTGIYILRKGRVKRISFSSEQEMKNLLELGTFKVVEEEAEKKETETRKK